MEFSFGKASSGGDGGPIEDERWRAINAGTNIKRHRAPQLHDCITLTNKHTRARTHKVLQAHTHASTAHATQHASTHTKAHTTQRKHTRRGTHAGAQVHAHSIDRAATPPDGDASRPRLLTASRGDGLLLPNQHDQPFATRDTGIEQVPLQHSVVLRHHRDDDRRVFRTLALVDRRGVGRPRFEDRWEDRIS